MGKPSNNRSELTANNRVRLDRHTELARVCQRAIAERTVLLGHHLAILKDILGPDAFRDWLDATLEWTEAPAELLIEVDRRFSAVRGIEKFQPAAVLILSNPAVPQSAVHEAIDRAAAGETITHRQAQQIAARHGTATP